MGHDLKLENGFESSRIQHLTSKNEQSHQSWPRSRLRDSPELAMEWNLEPAWDRSKFEAEFAGAFLDLNLLYQLALNRSNYQQKRNQLLGEKL